MFSREEQPELVQGRYDAAREQFTRVLEIRRQLGDRVGEAACLRALDELGAGA